MLPGMGLALPGVQLRHVSLESLPHAELYLPAEHGCHTCGKRIAATGHGMASGRGCEAHEAAAGWGISVGHAGKGGAQTSTAGHTDSSFEEPGMAVCLSCCHTMAEVDPASGQ